MLIHATFHVFLFLWSFEFSFQADHIRLSKLLCFHESNKDTLKVFIRSLTPKFILAKTQEIVPYSSCLLLIKFFFKSMLAFKEKGGWKELHSLKSPFQKKGFPTDLTSKQLAIAAVAVTLQGRRALRVHKCNKRPIQQSAPPLKHVDRVPNEKLAESYLATDRR